MTLQPRLFFAAAVSAFALAAAAAPAQAGVEHQPPTGTPAYEVDAPDDWQVTRDDQGNLYLLAADHSGGLVLNMVANIDTATLNLDDLAAQSMVAAQAPPVSRKEPGSLGGISGMAYYSSIPEPSGAVSLKLILVKVDASHVASEGRILNNSATPAQAAALDALAARVHFIR